MNLLIVLYLQYVFIIGFMKHRVFCVFTDQNLNFSMTHYGYIKL